MSSIQDLEIETTEDLLEYIRWKNDPDYADQAKNAFRVFTFRFQLPLLKKLIPICKNWGYDEQVATEIAYDTFDRIWKYPKFDLSKAKQKDFNTAVLFYLYKIASHALADYKKNKEGTRNPFTGEEEIIRDFPDIESLDYPKETMAKIRKRYDLIKNALSRLSPKHKIIYLTYKQYEEETKEGFKLPRKLLKSLRTELDLTQTSIRIYRKEAFDKVDEYLNIYG